MGFPKLFRTESIFLSAAGFIEPIVKTLPMDYAIEMNRLIQLQMAGCDRVAQPALSKPQNRGGSPLASFQRDIKPLFRELDHDKMMSWFDLWDHAQVKANADDILTRLEEGDMPCDEAWPAERIEIFRKWFEEGAQP